MILFVLIIFLFTGGMAAGAEAGKTDGVIISSDEMEVVRDQEVAGARGNVVIEQGQMTLETDEIKYERKTGNVFLPGHFLIFSPEFFIEAENGLLNLKDRTGELYEAEVTIYEGNYHIRGEYVRKRSDDLYIVKNGRFTTCNCPAGESPLWSFNARRVSVRPDDKLSASHVYFSIKRLPVLYLPYLIMPVRQDRQTGLLIPELRYSRQDGLHLRQGFFWAITPSRDITISYEERQKRGRGGGLDYRYILRRDNFGRLRADYFNDTQDDKKRWFGNFSHDYLVTKSSAIRADIQYLNEIDIFTIQRNDNINDRASLFSTSDLYYEHRSGVQTADLLFRYSKSLVTEDNSATIQKLPQISYAVLGYKIGRLPLYWNLDMSATNFWSGQSRDTERGDVLNTLTYDREGVVSLAASFSVRDTMYRISEMSSSENRLLYNSSIDAETVIFKRYSGVLHLLVPSVTYEYIQSDSTGEIPVFDDVEAVSSKNAVTFSLNSYLKQRVETDNFKGWRDFLFVKLYDTLNADGLDSDLHGNIAYTPRKDVSIGSEVVFSTEFSRFTTYLADISYKSKLLNLSGGFTAQRRGTASLTGDAYGAISQSNFTEMEDGRLARWKARVNLPKSFSFENSGYYNPKTGNYPEIKYILYAVFQCVEFMLSYEDLPKINRIRFMIGLKGFGDLEELSDGD